MQKLTTKEFIKRAKECHEIQYDYSKTEYKGRHEKVLIICPEHGEFWQEAGSHLKGTNCPKCPCQYSLSRFIENANKIHNNYYDYSKVKYTKMHDPVTIICPVHGKFQQKPYKHLQGQGCPICGQIKVNQLSISKGEQFIKNWLIKNKIEFSWQYPIITDTLARHSNTIFVDFYLEYDNQVIIIEYNGRQHYEYVPYFQHSEEEFKKQQRRDKVLRYFCKINNIKLIEFKYTLSLLEVEKQLSQMFNISFDFDEVTHKVSNLKVTSSSKVNLDEGEALVQLMDNKLKLTPKAISMINVQPGDRIQVNYWTENNQNTFPLIGKSEIFTDKEEGSKLSKSNTVSFRGNKNSTLKIYGNLFKLEQFKEGMFKLVKVENEPTESVEHEQSELDDLNNSEIDNEIENLISQADNDLPF